MIAWHWDIDPNYTGPEEDTCGDGVVSMPEFFTNIENKWQLTGLKPCCIIEGKNWTEIMTQSNSCPR